MRNHNSMRLSLDGLEAEEMVVATAEGATVGVALEEAARVAARAVAKEEALEAETVGVARAAVATVGAAMAEAARCRGR